jgi:hypothetical protein
MKFLNLDDIAVKSERTVKLGPNTYDVKDFNVSEFVLFQQAFTKFKAAYESTDINDAPKVVDLAVEIAALGVPDMPADAVRSLNPLQMLALVSMIANLLPEADAETTEAVAEAKKESQEGQSPE